jgi:hypothetical protein
MGEDLQQCIGADVLVDNRLSMKEESSGTGEIDLRLLNTGPIHARVTDAFQLEPRTHGQWGTRAGRGKRQKVRSVECGVREAYLSARDQQTSSVPSNLLHDLTHDADRMHRYHGMLYRRHQFQKEKGEEMMGLVACRR